MTGWPVGFNFLSSLYGKRKGTLQWKSCLMWIRNGLFGKREIDSWAEQDWRFVKSDSLYLAMAADETTFSCMDGHAILSQKAVCGK